MRFLATIACLALSTSLMACMPVPTAQVSKAVSDGDLARDALPAMQAFAPGAPIAATRSNAEMAGDFLDLVFRMESGRALPVLSRFEGPVTVALAGAVPSVAPAEVQRVIGRLRQEAGIDISLAAPGQAASVMIEFQPRRVLRRAVPSAACFVVPNASSLSDYIRARGTAATDWGRVSQRGRVAIFVPSDTSPQEVRDCLHEELAQAIGPLNDLYRLPDSVFNDDNFHSVLTGFDMLMLRVQYAPELRSGMNEAEVAARLPAILARLNPAGQSIGGARRGLTARSWIATVEQTFTAENGAKLAGAEQMVAIARAQGWSDGRLAFSHFARARARTPGDMVGAMKDYHEAVRIWRATPGAAIHAAHAEMQLAAFALSAGRMDEALRLTEAAVPVARRHQNASLLSSLLAMRAEALEATGQVDAARAARLDSMGWARYAFGSDAQVRARMQDIAALAARGQRG